MDAIIVGNRTCRHTKLLLGFKRGRMPYSNGHDCLNKNPILNFGALTNKPWAEEFEVKEMQRRASS